MIYYSLSDIHSINNSFNYFKYNIQLPDIIEDIQYSTRSLECVCIVCMFDTIHDGKILNNQIFSYKNIMSFKRYFYGFYKNNL